MGYRKTPFALGEWYHCYTRGIDKRSTFQTERDFERFIEALYLSNNTESVERGRFQHKTHAEILELDRSKPLVAIGAYCLMPNHFHLCLKELRDGGISKFMQRVGTSYGKYFNIKNDRIGNLFVKPFRAKHIASDEYLTKVIQYIHLNPVELYEPQWKEGIVRDMHALLENIRYYSHSSLLDYEGNIRPESALISWSEVNDFLLEKMPPLASLLDEARAYYEELA